MALQYLISWDHIMQYFAAKALFKRIQARLNGHNE